MITLPISPETLAKMEKAGWSDVVGDGRWWLHDRKGLSLHVPSALGSSEPAYMRGRIPSSSFDVPLDAALEAAAILGIAPPGYRLVPESVAVKALPLLTDAVTKHQAEDLRLTIAAEHSPDYHWSYLSERAEAHQAKANALQALASALEGKDAMPNA